MAREKERRLLQQEKQLYQARLRSEIRAKLAGKSSGNAADHSSSGGGYGPMSSKEHIKALADRFMKEGAEDLWNEDDGPIRSVPRKRPTDPAPALDLRKLVADRRNLVEARVGESRSSLASFDPRRQYSVVAGRGLRPVSQRRWRRNSSSEEDSDSDSGFDQEGDAFEMHRETELGMKKDSIFPRFSFGNEEELNEAGGRIARKKMMSGTALGNYDVKTERRVPRPVEEKNNFADEIQEIRRELGKRNLFSSDARQHGAQEETLFTKRRFDECSISPLTIKALADARYVQMTVVQEAALPVCLDGKDALVKAKTGTGKSAAFLVH